MGLVSVPINFEGRLGLWRYEFQIYHRGGHLTSIAAIANFYPGYDELANRIGLAQTRLRLVIDPHATRRQLDRWRAAVLEGSIARKAIRRVPDGPFVVRVIEAPDGIRTELGHDPSGKNWTVEINEARQTGNPNALSAVAVDAQGRSYLLRQGLLRKNGETEKGVSPPRSHQGRG
ncbi:hypothetical protein [Mesorhizobium sp. WSM2561]|uniref:hypothetical protein n=1 Tax=Mesorhizobium sp. WSM2561 TaxID=1040985 RepID=UPI0012ECB775|nr:hypothetical protein [Mesorhizobium sp. WSM2561]